MNKKLDRQALPELPIGSSSVDNSLIAQEIKIPMPKSETTDLVQIEQAKAGFKEVKTSDGKGEAPESDSYMRTGYWFDERVKETFIPLNERKIIFRIKYPNGAIRAKLTTSSYKSATADAAMFRDANDAQPFATDSGAANQQDLSFNLKKKVAQVATSNATYRAFNQAGIPMTLTELYDFLKNNNLSKEEVIPHLNNNDKFFVEGWKIVEANNAQIFSTKESDWKDVDVLESELEIQSDLIKITEEIYVSEKDLIMSLENEIVMNANEPLAQKILGVLKKFTLLKSETIIPEEISENKEDLNQPSSNSKKHKTRTRDRVKQSNYFIARDGKTGHIVKEFKNRQDAATWAKIAPNSISAAISPASNNRTAGGYTWTKERK